jgi:hypothetical protein
MTDSTSRAEWMSEEDRGTLESAVENMRSADRDERTIDARWRLAEKLAKMAARTTPQQQAEPVAQHLDALMKLARYGVAMLHWHRGDNPSEIGDVDAITCQEEAMRCGVLEGRNVDAPCCDQCECAPFDGWDVCYFVPDDVRAARAALGEVQK